MSEFGHEYPRVLKELSERLSDLFTSKGLPHAKADELARDTAECIRHEWGGQNLYIPKGLAYKTAAMHQTIRERLRGGERARDLAREYGLTKEAVNRIARQGSEREGQGRKA